MPSQRSLSTRLIACATFPLLALTTPSFAEQSSTWRRTGELTGVNKNPTRVVEDGRLLGKSELKIVLDGGRFDPQKPVRLHLLTKNTDAVVVEAFDVQGKKIVVELQKGGAFVEERPGEIEFHKFEGVSLKLSGRSEAQALRHFLIRFDPSQPVTEAQVFFELADTGTPVNMAPAISKPANSPAGRAPEIEKTENGFTLSNPALKAVFSTKGGLRLVSLFDEFAGKDILLDPSKTGLFLVDTGDGRTVTARDWVVKETRIKGDSAEVLLEGGGLEASFTATVTAEHLRLGLEMVNISGKEHSWKTVFPQIGGISVSDNPDDDYYCYPFRGGIVQKVNTDLRLFYAANEAMWQMVDVYSPGKGSGISMRSLDEGGLLKGIAFRKGVKHPAFARAVTDLGNRLEKGMLWKQSLTPGKGSAMGFEYQRHTRETGGRFKYPDAVIEIHPGDWKAAMSTYAKWAHSVWKWRSPDTAIRDVWLIQTITASLPSEPQVQKRLYNFETKEWYGGYREDGIDMGEFRHWWEWSEKGPFGVSLDQGREETLRQMHNKWNYFFMDDPVRGKLVNAVNDGDYAYNTSMEGLEGLKKGIATAHEAGALVQFYTDPFIVDSTTEMGKNYGRKHSVVNPHVQHTPGPLPETPKGDHLITYAKWSMCTDNEDYQQAYANNMARLVGDTQVDGIRLDQFGYTGFVCYSKEHTHQFAEPGEHAVMRSMKALMLKVRAACSAKKPDILLTGEYAGCDFLAGELDGALLHEMRWAIPGFRPLPLNIFRFYFPGVTLFENVTSSHSFPSKAYHEIMLWNGVGLFQRPWPENYHRILRENADAFRSTQVEPLVSTLQDYLYANRFATGRKTITVLLNDREKPIEGPAMPAQETASHHYFDLLNGVELPVAEKGLVLKVSPKRVAVVARLPRALAVQSAGDGVKVLFPSETSATTVVLCNAEGAPLDRKLAQDGPAIWETLPEGAAYVKLLSGKYLVDAISLPQK